MRALPALLLLGCAGGDSPATSSENPAVEGWIDALLREPAAFSRLVADPDQRGAWAALHRGHYAAAAAADGPAATAARARAAAYEADLARLSELAWPLTFGAWEEHAGLPVGSAIPVLVAASLLDAGQGEAARAWLARLSKDADDDRQHSARALAPHAAEGADPALAAGLPLQAGEGVLGRCLRAHQDARRAASPLPPGACGQPLLEEPAAGSPRRLYDPLAHRTRALALTEDPIDDNALAARIFTDGWACAPGAPGAGCGAHRAALGLPLAPPDAGGRDNPDQAQDVLAAFDLALAARVDAWSEGAGVEGRDLLEDLRLADVFRSRALVSLARDALLAGQPRSALVFALAARDMGAPRSIGPASPPELFALTAEAQLRAGRSREALDALQVLVQVDPQVLGLAETIGDLSVLETLNRRGDSKER